jgi:hypothetical protein
MMLCHRLAYWHQPLHRCVSKISSSGASSSGIQQCTVTHPEETNKNHSRKPRDALLPSLQCSSLYGKTEGKGKVVPLRSIEAHLGDRRYSSYRFLTSALEGGEWSASRPGRALPPGKEPPVPTVQEAGWASAPVWRG